MGHHRVFFNLWSRSLRHTQYMRPLLIPTHQPCLTISVGAIAAPCPLIRLRHRTALHRIAMHVAQLLHALLFGPHVVVVKAALPDLTLRERIRPKPPSLLTNPCLPRYDLSSLLYGADLGFHAEWLRDEPYEATTTGSEFIFWSPGVNSRPIQGEHEIRGAEFLASRSSFPLSRERGFRVSGHFPEGSSRIPLRSEWLK